LIGQISVRFCFLLDEDMIQFVFGLLPVSNGTGCGLGPSETPDLMLGAPQAKVENLPYLLAFVSSRRDRNKLFT